MNASIQFNQNDAEAYPTFEDALQQIGNDKGNMPDPDILYGLSALTDAQLMDFQRAWNALEPTQRQLLLQMMVDVALSNLDMDFERIGAMAMHDSEASVRQVALELLSESESLDTLAVLTQALSNDDALAVKVGAGRALGNFVLLGELGKLPDRHIAPVRQTLFGLLEDHEQPTVLRSAALESIANCSHASIAQHIVDAYRHDDAELRTSAVVAMGRSCDERWADTVLDELENGDEFSRMAAARAAGELQIEEAVPGLTRLYQDADTETRMAIIWSLGEIGGREALRLLENALEDAEQADDVLMIDAIDEAMGNASLLNGDLLLGDFDMPLDD